MNGWIIVGTKVDTKELDRQLKNLEKDLIKYGKEYEGLLDKKANIELNVDFKNYLDAKAKLEDLEAKYQEAKKTVGTIDLSQPGSANLYNNAVEKMSSLRSEMAVYQSEVKNGEKAFEGQIIKLDEINQKIGENIEKQKAVKTEVSKINEKLSEVKRNEMLNSGFNGIKSSINSVGNSLEDLVKKTVRWGLAIFGVRTAYMFIRQAISSLSQYDEKLATNIEYIRFALASVLKPVIETIINLVYKLLVYIAYIAKAWFGVNLFANASVKAFQSVNKSVKNTNKSAKELQKTLAGFDEMNVLQKNGSTKVGGGGGGVPTPDIDLSQWDKIKIPDWVKWIADNRDLILGFLAAIAGIIAGIKIAKFISGIAKAIASLTKFKLALGLIVGGLAILGKAIVDTILHWDTMTAKQKILTTALGGLGGALTGIGIALATGAGAAAIAIAGVVGAIVGMVAVIGTAIVKHELERKAIYSVQKQEEALANAKKKSKEAYDEYINAVDRQEEALKKLKEVEKSTGLSGEELYKKVEKGTLTYKQMTSQQRETYKAYMNLKTANEQLAEAEEKTKQTTQEVTASEYGVKIANDKTGASYKDLKKEIIDAWDKGKISTKQATDLMNRLVGNMDTKTTNAFTKDIPDAIKGGMNPNKYKSTLDRLRDSFINAIDRIKNAWNDLWGKNRVIKIEAVAGGGGSSWAKGGIIYHKLPKLASGGIINQPGRGVPLGGAIGGERGIEGVLPLTDSQQMELLGQAIGRYITINASITNMMNGRVIGRELQKIQNENDFAFNR